MKNISLNDGVRDLPDMTCPKCNTVMSHGVTIQNAKPTHKVGDILVCSTCAVVSRVSEGGLVIMSRGDIEKLDDQSKMILAAAVASIRTKMTAEKDIVSPNGVRG
jgi:RNase P subunit RPR2